MFTLLRPNEVDLRTGRSQRSEVVTPDTEKQDLGYIAKIKADPSSVWAAVLANLFPNDISLILKSPRFHNGQTIWQECVGNPKVQMAFRGSDLLNRQSHDIL